MSLSRLELLAGSVALGLAGASSPHAGPLTFTGPWQVDLTTSPVTGNGMWSLPDPANPIGNVVESASSPSLPLGVAATSSAAIHFFRTFTLAPGATYTLFLNASLSGNLKTGSISSVFATDTATANADALIETPGGVIVLDLTGGSGGLSFTINGQSTATLPIDTGVVKASTAVGAIPPGNYDIFGTFDVDASTSLNLLPGLQAIADANFLLSGSVSAVAAPIPEPSSALLLPIGLLALLCPWRRWRRHRAGLRLRWPADDPRQRGESQGTRDRKIGRRRDDERELFVWRGAI